MMNAESGPFTKALRVTLLIGFQATLLPLPAGSAQTAASARNNHPPAIEMLNFPAESDPFIWEFRFDPTFRGSAKDTDGSIKSVTATLDGSAPVAAEPLESDWSDWIVSVPIAQGSHSVCFQAVDDGGAETEVCITVERPVKNPADLFVLTPFTDVWASKLAGGQYASPSRLGFIGFRHDTAARWKGFAAHIDGDGLTDFATVTPDGELWTTLNDGVGGIAAPSKQSGGWMIDEDLGFTVVAGDFNGDGLTDFLQLTPDDLPIYRFNDNGVILSAAGGWIVLADFRSNPGLGRWVGVADLSGDGIDDLFEVRNDSGLVIVCTGSSGGLADPKVWSDFGSTGLAYDPGKKRGIHAGDFDGNHVDDLLMLEESGARVLLSDGFWLGSPQNWGDLGFKDDPEMGSNGWWAFTGDVNLDGKCDLIQINDVGEAWMALSTGAGFAPPGMNAALGFLHKPQGPWQVFTGVAP